MELDPGERDRKRKRTSSGGCTLNSQHVTENLNHYGEVILHCTVNITYNIRACGNSIVLKYVCALLNSGGGILHMRNLDAERGVVLSKHLDTWWSGMEIKMAEILSRDDICNYFDLVGNHDDKDLYLFVKTAEHLCSLRYHCRLPTDTATHEVTYQSLLRLLVNHGEAGSLQELPPIPDRYIFGRSAEELKKETKQIQFKQLSAPQNKSGGKNTLPDRVSGLMIKYVSAFANHEGGHIYFGIGDARASVIGEELTLPDQKNLEWLVTNRMYNMMWRDSSVRPVRGVHWDINFYPVEKTPKNASRVVVVVSVCKFPGGVFTNCPTSSYINTEGHVVDFTFDQWKEAVLNPLRDVPELHHRFQKLSLMVPRAPLVFTLPDTVQMIKTKVLLAKPDEVQPRLYIESYAETKYRETIRNVFSYFKGKNSICLGMECWGLKIPMMHCNDILCDIAVVTELDSIHVLTLVFMITPQIEHHSQTVAAVLKNKLVQYGGCTEKFSVISHIIDLREPNIHEILDREMSIRDIYPTHFCSNKRKFEKIITSMAISMGAYMARSQTNTSMNQNGSYYFLLTHDQFELLWTQQFVRELWVHGPAGAGKTVAAIQMIQELRRRGCNFDNILYLAENEKLCDFVRSHDLCLVTTRRTLLADEPDKNLMNRKYGTVCNVIVDEVQNFKDRDGDWYSLAEKLANQRAANHLHRCCNYFWLFMDYAQKVHKFEAGLPSVIGKNNFMLSEVSRSTKEIFDFTSRLMMASEHAENICSPVFQHVQSLPKLAHNFSSGKGVDILSCKEAEMKNLLNRVVSGLLKNGVHENDIAILVGKRTELDRLQSTLSDIHLNESNTSEMSQKQQNEREMSTRRSVEEHLKHCGSDQYVGQSSKGKGQSEKLESSQSEYEDVSDDSLEDFDSIETGNQFSVLSSDSSDHLATNEKENTSIAMETGGTQKKSKVKFYRNESEFEDSDTSRDHESPGKNSLKNEVVKENGVAIDTVRRFSGLDKAAVIGINPYVNEEHADFKKFLLSLATRAKDNLVIITTSDNIKQQLDKFV
ncbi:schlafen family member 13-like isoform X1 [Ruditapes philippinarum]|uniref:schlafen family member 13-like isoform X1 n=1 Tax=Ruditapes philippinarum TaxID=129788 RepID=UPI00295B95BC|nr:schlafen family member 13-like isoform X1 [Ruditapes philippinarum]XP_060597673.1 schlafen family member 13-like isoform X1 [Ruditapes philippinarum]